MTESELPAAPLARQLLRSVPSFVYAYDPVTRTNLYQNRDLSAYLGHPPFAGPVFEAWAAYMHPEDRAGFGPHRERLQSLAPGEVASWECRLQRGDGQWAHFHMRDTLLAPEDARRIIVGIATDITERKHAEHQKDLILGEMRHRSKNFAAVVAAIARQTRPARPEDAMDAFDHLTTRIQTLLDAGDAVLNSRTREVSLGDVVGLALAPLLGTGQERVVIRGSGAIQLDEQRAGGIALVIHELTTNALKYGALARPEGRIDLAWSRDADHQVTLAWIESGGPLVTAPDRVGFGTRVLRSAIPGSTVEVAYPPAGFRLSLRFPTAGV